jgi:rSAM/selenodomain-associated transferase 1
MTKEPRAGQVKTRLTPPLTPEEAAALNVCFLLDISRAISITASAGNVRGFAVYTPEGAAAVYREIMPPEFQLVPQRGEALGDRMIFAMEDLFRLGISSVCLIGSDSPTVPLRAFAEAATILEETENTVVMGPTDDGGYYLIGLKRLERTLFEGISWSTDKVLEQTCQRAHQLKLEVHLLPAWYDVDERTTLRRLCEELFGPNENTAGYPAPATRDYLEGLLKREGREKIWRSSQAEVGGSAATPSEATECGVAAQTRT